MPEIIVKLGDRVVQKYLLYKDQKMTVGRAPDNDIALENPAVSRRHSTIQMMNGRYIIEDNSSANGTYVNGVRVTRTEILDKDVITIGKHKLHFYNQDAAAAAPAAPEAHSAGASVGVLRVTQGKQRDQMYELSKPETRVGRASDNDIRLADWFVSKHHAVIERKAGGFLLRDLDSWRHTMVNGEVIQEAQLNEGDEVQFGPKIAMRFEFVAPGEVSRRPVDSDEGDQPDGPEPQEYAEVGASNGESPHHEHRSRAVDDTGESPAADYNETPSAEGVPAWANIVTPEPDASPASQPEAEAGPSGAEANSGTDEYVINAGSNGDGRAAEGEPEPAAVAAESVQSEAGASQPAVAQAGAGAEASAEVVMWEKALANTSKVIRKQAARKLKQLTGRDYDID